MAKRVYKRDAQGRFAGGGGGSGGGSRGGKTRRPRISAGSRQKLRKVGKTIKKAAKNPEVQLAALTVGAYAFQGLAGVAIKQQGQAQTRAAENAFNRARTDARNRVSNTSGIGSGSATLRQARTRRGVYQL